MSPEEGLEAICEAKGIVSGASGWKPEIGALRDTPKSMAFILSGGRGGEAKVAIDYPTVQILVLGAHASGGYAQARDKAQDIYNALHGVDTPDAAYPNLSSCLAMGNPVWLGADDKDRPRFALNFRLIVVPDNEGDRNY